MDTIVNIFQTLADFVTFCADVITFLFNSLVDYLFIVLTAINIPSWLYPLVPGVLATCISAFIGIAVAKSLIGR